MTIKEIIDFVDGIKPNAFSNQQKTMWLNEAEGLVQTDVMLLARPSIVSYVYETAWSGPGICFPDHDTMSFPVVPGFRVGGLITIRDLQRYADNNLTNLKIKEVSSDGKALRFDADTFAVTGSEPEMTAAAVDFDGSETEMLALPPHHKIYYTYLMAMIDFANGEYGKYQNTMTLFNTFFNSYSKWFADRFQPADGRCEERGYYLSAYAIAVKHGFSGSEAQFLAALKGDRGNDGAGIVSITKSSGSGAPGTTDTYTIMRTDGSADTFTVYNGSDGTIPPVDAALSSLSINPVRNSVIKSALDNKADLMDGTIPSSQLPSYVDDVIEMDSADDFPVPGESGKIYVAVDTNKTFRWSGSAYVEISASLALGETSATAYRGDRGAISYTHSQTIGNPHGTTKNDLGLGSVDNTADANKAVSIAAQTALDAKQEKITNALNRLFYGSGTSGALNQMAFPDTSGSVLRQDTGGAPYWTTPSALVAAMKASLADTIYPVGSIYMSVSSTSPATLFGGTWTQIKGRFLLGVGSNDANTNNGYGSLAAGGINRSVNELGGEVWHSLTTDEMPNHSHYAGTDNDKRAFGGSSTTLGPATGNGYATLLSAISTSAVGGSGSHNNMPPYLAVYMWKRSA